jgi:hypothetical protein
MITDMDIFLTNPSNIAKVILLGGQSNAEGQGAYQYISEYDSRYDDGYENVRMLTHTRSLYNTRSIIVDTDLPTQIGFGAQSSDNGIFGPELGLAKHLAENYPNETFYIIKYAIGGSVLDTDWYATDGCGPYLRAMTQKIESGLQYLQNEGYTPQI